MMALNLILTPINGTLFKYHNFLFQTCFSIQNGINPVIQMDNEISFNYFIKHEVILPSGISISTFRTCLDSHNNLDSQFENM